MKYKAVTTIPIKYFFPPSILNRQIPSMEMPVMYRENPERKNIVRKDIVMEIPQLTLE
jgi:hypothetical protein